MNNNHIPAPVLTAMRHVREFLPAVDRVVFWSDGRWRWFTENYEAPAFVPGIDINLIQDACDSLTTLPAVFQWSPDTKTPEPEHTPGPWHVQKSDHSDVGLLVKPVPGHVIAECDPVPEMEANARLIAAAPDMLDALLDCRATGRLPVPTCNRVVTAITRALGPDWQSAQDGGSTGTNPWTEGPSDGVLFSAGKCPACGSRELTWHAGVKNHGGGQDGRVCMREAGSIFFLGCDRCSETIRVIPGDKVARMLTGMQEESTGAGFGWLDPEPGESDKLCGFRVEAPGSGRLRATALFGVFVTARLKNGINGEPRQGWVKSIDPLVIRGESGTFYECEGTPTVVVNPPDTLVCTCESPSPHSHPGRGGRFCAVCGWDIMPDACQPEGENKL